MDHLNLKQVIQTADLPNRTLRGLITRNRGMHAETPVARSARMAGSPVSTGRSRLSLSETRATLEPWFSGTLNGSQPTLCEVAASAAMTTALVIHDCCDEMDVHAGRAIATDGFVEPTRRIPAAWIPA